MKRKLILIAGIPGTGKTTIGNFLEKEYHYKHFNMEDYHRTSKITKDLDKFIKKYFNGKKKIILTWGFRPNKKIINIVNLLNRYGFKNFWFTGNRNYARKSAMQRKTFYEKIFRRQIEYLDKWNVPKAINAKIISVFDKEGKFKKVTEIAKEVRAI